MKIKEKVKKYFSALASDGLNLIVLSMLTGMLVGVPVTFYNILVGYGEETSRYLYSLIRQNPAFILLFFIVLAAGALVVGTLVKFVPMIRGSGIPQTEGASRGLFRFKWYFTACSMFAASLACIFLGLSADGEGPSIELGGCIGEAVGGLFKRSQMARRLQIAAGASAGLAVAANAPVTGLFFALEESFRSFSAQVFICSAVSVVFSLLTRNLIRSFFGLSVGFTFEGFVFNDMNLNNLLFVLLAAAVTSLVGVAFYYITFATKKLFKKITFLKGVGKYLIPFLAAGVFGLITPYAMGGGHELIVSLATGGTGEYSLETIFGSSISFTLIIVFAFKFIAAVLAMACGVPCGVFIPMLAVGAVLGALLSMACQTLGMDPACADYLVIICMSVFFVTVVKAPITAIVMTFELTGQFQNMLPALIGVAVGYLISELFRLEPIYERSLDQFVQEEKIYENHKIFRVQAVVRKNSLADGNPVRKIIWPTNGLVVEVLNPDGKRFIPDGETRLSEGQTIVFESESSSEKELLSYIYEITGKP